MNFRLSVTHLRVALLVANLGLAGGLVGMAGRGMMEASGTVSTVRVFEPSHFEFAEVEGFDARSNRTKIQPVAEWIEPTKRIAAPPTPIEDQGDEPEAITTSEEGSDYGGPGPLAEEWEYEFFYIFPDAPKESFVRLRRKGSEPEKAATNPRSRIIRGRARLNRAALRGKPGSPENELTFFVKERRIVDTEKELEFLVDEATPEYVAYRMPDNRNTVYRLPHVDESAMADYETKQTITIMGKREDDQPAEGEEEEEESKIKIVPDDYRDAREKEYQAWLRGEIPSLDAAPNLREETVEPAVPEDKRDGTAAASSVERFQGGTRQPISKEEGLRRMRTAIQDARTKGDMTADEEKLLKDAMTGKLKAPKKK